MKRILALLVCAITAAAVLTGCVQTVKSPLVSAKPSAAASASAPAASGSPTLNLAGAYKSLDPKTVMLTVDKKDITWETLFAYIDNAIEELQADGVQIDSWSGIYQDETTYKDYVLTTAVNMLLSNAAVSYGAVHEAKVSLTPQDAAKIQSDWDTQVKSAGGEDAFMAKLKSHYITKDVYKSEQEANALYQDCFSAIYGERGSKLSDQDAAAATADDGYMMAKHIFFLTEKTGEDGSQVSMSDAEKAQVKKKAEEVLNQLKTYKGTSFSVFFDQLMNTNGQDPGMVSSPNGYLFQSDDSLVSQFIDATKALQVGQFTQELVETGVGYHIIYRVPVNYDTTPLKLSNYGDYTLREVTAHQLFKSKLDAWTNSLDITYSAKYKALDFNKIFAAG